MIKMYKAEVLAKLPVAQHFLFGTLLPFPDADIEEVESKTDGSLVVDHAGHLHVKSQQGWGECCGIPIPSSFAAATAENKNPAIRRIPFD
jgi:serine/threonine-protein phosphatase 2A activator